MGRVLGPTEIRDYLLADVALGRGIVDAEAVTTALRRRWRDTSGGSARDFPSLLGEAAGIPRDALRTAEAEVEGLIAAAGGDPGAALGRRGALSAPVSVAATASLERRVRESASEPSSGGPRLRSFPPDRYVDFLPVGEGGMGIVFAALDTDLQRVVAIKMIRPEGADPTSSLSRLSPLDARPPRDSASPATSYRELEGRFIQEAWVTGGLEHPGIVPVHEIGTTPGGVPYYTMRYVPGQQTLAMALRETRGEPVERRLTLLEPFLKVCDTVAFAHSRGVIHRDLKPENVALGSYGEVILLDWGLARLDGRTGAPEQAWQEPIRHLREAAELRTVAGLLGTPGYIAPEAVLGPPEGVTAASDVYSLGVILYEILTGRLPHDARDTRSYLESLTNSRPPPPVDVDPAVPAVLSDLCVAALSGDPPARPSSATALADAIRNWQATSALEAELESRRREAAQALHRAEGLEGPRLLAEVDQAVAALAYVTAKRPDDGRAGALLRRAATLRESEMARREREAMRRARRREGVRAAAVLLLLVAVGFGVVEAKAAYDRWSEARAHDDMQRRARADFHATDDLAPGEAIPLLEALLERHPDADVASEVRFRLGACCAALDRFDESQAWWTKARLEDPTDPASQRATVALARRFLAAGRLADVAAAVEDVLPYAIESPERCDLLLLSAETAWGAGRLDVARAEVEEAERSSALASPETLRRLSRLRQLLPAFQPLWRAGGTGLPQKAIGRFRGPAPLLVSISDDGGIARLTSFSNGSLGEEVMSWEGGGNDARLFAVDLHGDGVDELVHITGTAVRVNEAAGRTERLRVLDLSGAQPRTLAEVEVPYSWYQVAGGDVDADGDDDLVLGMSYPGTGILVLRNEGGGRFAPAPLGDMARLNDVRGKNNIRNVVVEDVTGDGRPEVVVSCEEWVLYDLCVFTAAPDGGGFVELPVRSPSGSDHLGRVTGIARHDLDEDGRGDILFAIGGGHLDSVRNEDRRFLPAGLYGASWRPEVGAFLVEPLGAAGLAEGPDARSVAEGADVSIEGLTVARGASGTYVVCDMQAHERDLVLLRWLTVWPMDRLGDVPFALVGTGESGLQPAVDLTGDGEDEILVCSNTGWLSVFGSVPLPPPAAGARTRPPPVDLRDRLATRRHVADRLAGQGLFEDAEADYRALLPLCQGTPHEAGVRDGLLSAVERQGRYDECLRLLETSPDLGLPARRRSHLRRIQYLDWMQEWDAASRALDDLSRAGGALEGDRVLLEARGAELEPWRRTEPRALPAFDDWGVTNPGVFRLRDGWIEVQEESGRLATLWSPLASDEGSFRLSFDLVVSSHANGHFLQVGLLPDESGGPQGRALDARTPIVRLTTNSESPLQVDLARPTRRPAQSPWATNVDGGQLTAGTPVRCTLAWDERGRRLGVTIRDARDGTHVFTMQTLVPSAGDHRPCRLAIQVDGEGYRGRTRIRLGNLDLQRPRDARPLSERPVTDPMERAHALLALGRAQEARSAYGRVAATDDAPAEVRVAARLLARLLGWSEDPTADRAEEVLRASEEEGSTVVLADLLDRAFLLPPERLGPMAAALFRRELARSGPGGLPLDRAVVTSSLRAYARAEAGAAAPDRALVRRCLEDLQVGSPAGLDPEAVARLLEEVVGPDPLRGGGAGPPEIPAAGGP